MELFTGILSLTHEKRSPGKRGTARNTVNLSSSVAVENETMPPPIATNLRRFSEKPKDRVCHKPTRSFHGSYNIFAKSLAPQHEQNPDEASVIL